MSENGREGFYCCEKCGKKLIKRMPNGLWHFCFGRRKGAVGQMGTRCPVNIFVHGSVRIQCLSDSCRHLNTFMYFPNPVTSESNDAETSVSGIETD